MEEARAQAMDHPLLLTAGYPVLLAAIGVLWRKSLHQDREIRRLQDALLAEKDRQIKTFTDWRDMLVTLVRKKRKG
jgi:hypothetical protein